MNPVEMVFWVSLLIIGYSFPGYGLLLYCIVGLKRIFQPLSGRKNKPIFEPELTLVVPCYNEADSIVQKIANCKELEYPVEKLTIVFITDGSTDHSMEWIKREPGLILLHEAERAGKTAAINRAMQFVKTPIVVFSDANSFLNKEAIRKIVDHFADQTTGCVSGEKRILSAHTDNASGSGESIYWQYESWLKKMDSAVCSAVGAVGELFAIRSVLYRQLPNDTLLDDFMQSMLIAGDGYRIVYEPEAYAFEPASDTIQEELKRKIRIAAGGWQAMKRLWAVLHFTKTPVLYFQYFSQRVIRRSLTPFLLPIIFFTNIPLVTGGLFFYRLVFAMQFVFYLVAFSGYLLRNQKTKFRSLFAPYYFCLINYAAIAGFSRFVCRIEDGIWEKSVRRKI